jgi:hypothetical protein
MGSRKEFLNQLWKENIACMQEQWIDNMIRRKEPLCLRGWTGVRRVPRQNVVHPQNE